MGSKREMMREWRRQADPSFPAAMKSRASKPPPPRPSEPPPSRPTEFSASRPIESSASRPSEPPPSRPPEPGSSKPGHGVLKGHKGRNKRKNKKGLRVSFDLENTQERVVPEMPEEAVVECWEDLSDGDGVGLGGPLSCDNPSKDDHGDTPGDGQGVERLMEEHDALEGVTYFGIRESWDDVAVEGISVTPDVQESRQDELVNDLTHEGVATPVLKGGVVTDLDLADGSTVLSAKQIDIVCPQGLTDVVLEAVSDVSHPDEMEVSHLEELPERSHSEELKYMSYESKDVSHDGLNHTEQTHVKKTEELNNVTRVEELNDRGGNGGETDARSSEDLTDASHLEQLIEVTVPEEWSDVSHLEKITNPKQASELTGVSYLEGVTRSDSKEATDVSHLAGLTDLRNTEEPTDMISFELTEASHSCEMIGALGHLELTDESHSEVTDVNHLERLTDTSYLEEPSQMSNCEELTELSPDKENNMDAGMKHSEEQTCGTRSETLTGATDSEAVNSGSGNDELTDINPDTSMDSSHEAVMDKVLTGQQQDALFVLSDAENVVVGSYGETPGAGRRESTSSLSGSLEADSCSDGPASALTCLVKAEHAALPPAPCTEEEDPLEGTSDDDDEWETESNGESEETSENTWEAECGGNIAGEQQSPPDDSRKDSDSLILNDDIEAVLLALIEDQEKAVPPVVLCDDQPQEENYELAARAPLGEQRKHSERETSPQVTVGYECRDRKPTSVYVSETESEGELVPCEDKCVGTFDQSDDEPLDLSARENVLHEGVHQNKVVDCQERELSLDTSKQYTLASPEVLVGGSSPSPEIPGVPEEGKCMGNSESGTEKDKINGRKVGKKKGKRNKREVKAESTVISVDVAERPKLVRGRAWKEKREKVNAKSVGLLSLSFGSELCVSEVVEGTSNLLTETYTETSILTPTRCPLGTTVFTETPCTACSSVSGEFSESDNLHAECKCGEQRPEDAGVVALVAEVKTCDDAPESVSEPAPKPATELTPEPTPEPAPELILEHAPEHNQEPIQELALELTPEYVSEPTSEPALQPSLSLAPSTVTVQVTRASDEEDNRVPSPTGAADEFFIVRTRIVAAPSQVLTEYVEDTESEEDTKLSVEEVDSKPGTSFTSQELTDGTFKSPKTPENSPNMTKYKDSIYVDADGSGCTDSLNESFDYEKSFPKVLGTQQLNLIYSYDSDPHPDSESGQGSTEGERQTPNSERSSFVIHSSEAETSRERNEGDAMYTSGWGEIIYEGPCLCGDAEIAREPRTTTKVVGRVSEAGHAGVEEQLCVPSVRVSDVVDVAAGVGNEACEGAIGSEPPTFTMESNQEDQGSEGVGSAKDIRLRINEIVGGRLQRDRGRIVNPEMREEGGCPEEHQGGREDSPLPGSSPASSSGVQGSDEMSLSRSRSRSPSREESVSPACTPHELPECSQEPRPAHLLTQDRYEREALESLRALRFEGSIDSTSEKSAPVDCSFRTFRDMYQINPIYLTDSDDHDDLNESDTVVPVSASLDYDPERSITVTSWSSTSDCSPDPPELRPSPPLPGTQATKKVPKVNKLLRETQGIVQRWEVLQAQAVERQRQSSQVRELQRQVKNLRLSLEALGEQASELTKADDIDNRLKLIQKLQAAKALQEDVSARKTEVSSINLAVHRFLTETGYSLAGLKDDVADLYRLWDEADRRVSSEVSRLESVDSTWKLWETQAEELTKMLRQDGDTLRVLDVAIQTGSMTDSNTESMKGVARLLNDKRKTQPGKKLLLLQHTKTQSVDIQGSSMSLAASGDECLSDSGTSGYESCSSEELSERERRLANLRRMARDLEASLHPNSRAWAAICKTLSSAEAELKGLQQHCRELVVRSSESLDKAKTSPQLRRRMWSKDSKVGKAGRRTNNASGSGRNGGRRGWVWRVVKAALPFQAALLLLFCVACLLEPNCCDHVNTLNLSLSPQLRYVHGPPPV